MKSHKICSFKTLQLLNESAIISGVIAFLLFIASLASGIIFSVDNIITLPIAKLTLVMYGVAITYNVIVDCN
ncbi:hypothetical protein [Mucilaginibacter sp. AK015]|uniref:hypothetical protein n=1 Tax=Mucilaginibacter sp. AK015 TaxID=2723072 RepID=UPI00160A170B|nr:hypothetical protein [Mucilaginibacter sp. AK015]MBB5397182.1 hypothetical protein [Mucilaginibacter sp. AK015]